MQKGLTGRRLRPNYKGREGYAVVMGAWAVSMWRRKVEKEREHGCVCSQVIVRLMACMDVRKKYIDNS